MPIRDLKAQIARLPEQPGVYLYFNEEGETLYVGKARVLRDRVRSYLGAYGMSPRIDALLDEAHRLETIITDSVVEALALENNLIKQRSPKYNILLRDDKTYPYLQLTTGEAFPRVLVARRVERDGHFYAGPFMPASLARKAMSLSHKLFGIRSCNEVITGERGRPCLEHDIKRCAAPCVHSLCSESEYRVAVEHTQLFLEGRNDELVTTLRDRMTEAAAQERFEQAAQLRDALKTIETLRTRQQKMASPEFGDRDAFGLKLGPAGAVVQVFQMRRGRVVERTELVTDPGVLGSLDALDSRAEDSAAGTAPDAGASRTARCRPARADRMRRAPGGGAAVLHGASRSARDPRAGAVSGRRHGAPGKLALGALRAARPHHGAAARREARPARPGLAQRRGRLPGPVQRERRRQLRRARNLARRAGAALAAAPHRVLRHLDDPGQRDGGVDGRLRRRADEEGGISEVQDSRAAVRGSAGPRSGRAIRWSGVEYRRR